MTAITNNESCDIFYVTEHRAKLYISNEVEFNPSIQGTQPCVENKWPWMVDLDFFIIPVAWIKRKVAFFRDDGGRNGQDGRLVFIKQFTAQGLAMEGRKQAGPVFRERLQADKVNGKVFREIDGKGHEIVWHQAGVRVRQHLQCGQVQ